MFEFNIRSVFMYSKEKHISGKQNRSSNISIHLTYEIQFPFENFILQPS